MLYYLLMKRKRYFPKKNTIILKYDGKGINHISYVTIYQKRVLTFQWLSITTEIQTAWSCI